MRLNFASCPLNAPGRERAAPPKLNQDFCSPSFFLLAVCCTAPTKHARSHACTRSHTRTCARARISALGTCTTRSTIPPPPPPYHQWGWQGGGGSLGGGGGGTEGEGPAGKGAQSRQPPPAPGLAPPSPSDSFRTDGVPNTSQGTPALPRPPTPHRVACGPLQRLLHIVTQIHCTGGRRGGGAAEGRGRRGGTGGRTEGGREGERLSASRRCRWRKGVTSG